MWRKIFTLSMLLSANLVVQIEAIKFKVSGKLVFPEDGVYTHIPANSCLVVKVVEHILCDGQCDALRLSGKSIIHNVTFSSNIFEYELTCEHLMLPYILSSRLHIGWCPSPDYKGPYIEKGDYENEFGYRFQMRGYEIEYNASDMKMVPYDSLGLCGTKQCDLKSESCQVNENGKAYCRCNVQGGCKTTTTTAIPTTTTTPPPTTTTTTPTTTTTTIPTTTTTTPTTTTTTPTTTTTTPTTTTTTSTTTTTTPTTTTTTPTTTTTTPTTTTTTPTTTTTTPTTTTTTPTTTTTTPTTTTTTPTTTTTTPTTTTTTPTTTTTTPTTTTTTPTTTATTPTPTATTPTPTTTTTLTTTTTTPTTTTTTPTTTTTTPTTTYIDMKKYGNSGGGKSIDGKVGDKNYILIYAINGGCFLFFILLLVCVVCVCKGRKRANSENARRSNNTSAMGSLRKDRIMIDLAANEYDKRQKAKENVYVDLPAYLTEAPPSYTVYEDEKPPIYDEIAAYKARVGIE